MGFLGKLFKKDDGTKVPRGFHKVNVAQVNRLSKDAVEVVFDIQSDLKDVFAFKPGQYITIIVELNGQQERRSYSICSAKNAPLAIAVKEVEGGRVSTYVNQKLNAGQEVLISAPEGRFLLGDAKNVVAIAAGSGITPIMSMAYELENASVAKLQLLYANKTEADILFRSTIDGFKNTSPRYYLTQEVKDGFQQGRIGKDAFMAFIKEDLGILKADGFFICGPEEMIFSVKEALELFGVAPSKIHFELFNPTAPKEETKTTATETFNGTAKVKVIVDDEAHTFEMPATKTILDAAVSKDIDAPYSCRGGVCSTCRAKVIKGSANMTLNYTLTDKEVEDGYILTCQSHPTSSELTISYDE